MMVGEAASRVAVKGSGHTGQLILTVTPEAGGTSGDGP